MRAVSATLVPLICTSTVLFSVPVTSNVEPSNVKFPLSSSSPPVPATTTLLSVKSDTLAVEATRPAPPEILAPPLASIIPATVAIPATLRSSLI